MEIFIDEYLNNEKLIKTQTLHLQKLVTNLDYNLCNSQKQFDLEEQNEAKNLKESLIYISGNTDKFSNKIPSNTELNKFLAFINNIKIDNKKKYEKLLEQEVNLTLDLNMFEKKLELQTNKLVENENLENLVQYSGGVEEPNEKIEKVADGNGKDVNELDEIMINILNERIFLKHEFPEDELQNIIGAIDTLELVKYKINVIEEILATKLKGKYLGWKNKDHDDFIKIVVSHNNNINTLNFLVDLEQQMAFLPKSELKTHLRLYQKFLHFTAIKKMLLEQYKKLSTTKVNEEIIEVKKEKIEPIQKDKKKIDEWKKEKSLIQLKILREKLEEEKAKKEREKQYYKEKTLKAKNQLVEFKIQKEENQIKRQKSACGFKKPEINPIDLERINERNNKLLEKKKKEKELDKKELEYNFFVENKKKFSNVESLLLNPTYISEVKKRKKFDPNEDSYKDAYTMGGNVLGKTALKTPEWRKNL